jgi:hypothetical protein
MGATMNIDWTTTERDTEIKVSNARGRFFFRGINIDGSISVWGGTAHQQMMRSFLADRCRPIQRRKVEQPAWAVDRGAMAAPTRKRRR